MATTIIIQLFNLVLLAISYQIYKRIPRTTGLTIDYFKGNIEEYDNIPTY